MAKIWVIWLWRMGSFSLSQSYFSARLKLPKDKIESMHPYWFQSCFLWHMGKSPKYCWQWKSKIWCIFFNLKKKPEGFLWKLWGRRIWAMTTAVYPIRWKWLKTVDREFKCFSTQLESLELMSCMLHYSPNLCSVCRDHQLHLITIRSITFHSTVNAVVIFQRKFSFVKISEGKISAQSIMKPGTGWHPNYLCVLYVCFYKTTDVLVKERQE